MPQKTLLRNSLTHPSWSLDPEQRRGCVSSAKFDLPTLWHPKRTYCTTTTIGTRHLYSPQETTETRLKEFPCIYFDRESAISLPAAIVDGRRSHCIAIQTSTKKKKLCSNSEIPTYRSIAMLKAKVSA